MADVTIGDLTDGGAVQGSDRVEILRSSTSYQATLGGASAAAVSDTAPLALGTAAAGTASALARYDHVHPMPSAADVGAPPTARQVAAGAGLTGGGDLTQDRTLAVDVPGLTEDTSPDGTADYVMTHDGSAGGHKRVLLDNLPGGSGGVDVEDGGTTVVSGASAINLGANLTVTDDGDGTATVDAASGSGSGKTLALNDLGAVSSNITLDASAYGAWVLRPADAITVDFSGWSSGVRHLAEVHLKDGGSHPPTFSNVRWSGGTVPSLGTGLDQDVLEFFTRDAGTTVFGRLKEAWPAYWQALGSVIPARHGAMMVSLNGYLWVFGGYNDSGWLDDLWRYDPGADSWTQMASAPPARFGGAMAALNGYLWVYGGHDGSFLNDLWRYDPASDSWTQMASGPSARRMHTMDALNGYLWVFGGYDGSSAFNDLWRYDPGADSWTQMASGPSARRFHTMAILNGYIWVFGGYDGSSFADLWRYDPASNSWTQMASSPSALRQHAMIACNGYIWVFGGYDGSNPLDYFWRYDPGADSWVQIGSGPSARRHHMMAALNDHLWLFGGNDGSYLNDLHRYGI